MPLIMSRGTTITCVWSACFTQACAAQNVATSWAILRTKKQSCYRRCCRCKVSGVYLSSSRRRWVSFTLAHFTKADSHGRPGASADLQSLAQQAYFQGGRFDFACSVRASHPAVHWDIRWLPLAVVMFYSLHHISWASSVWTAPCDRLAFGGGKWLSQRGLVRALLQDISWGEPVRYAIAWPRQVSLSVAVVKHERPMRLSRW